MLSCLNYLLDYLDNCLCTPYNYNVWGVTS